MATSQSPCSNHSIVRLNATLFPVSPFELEAYGRYGITPKCLDVSGRGILEQARDCDAICVVSESLTAEVIEGLTRCRVISRLGAGTDKIDHAAATRMGILITNVPDFCAEEQADHSMALLLSLVRKLTQMRSAMLAGRWNDARETCRPIHRMKGKTIGLVGFGLSAKGMARRAKGFGLRVIATRKNSTADDPEARGLVDQITDLQTLLRESDYVSLHLPLNTETSGLFDAEHLSMMKPGAILINTSRGALVDEQALATSLREGHLGGAGIDTFHGIDVHGGKEGVPPVHPLLELENCVFTPHVAAFSVESARDVGLGAVENLAAVLSGRWPSARHIVNPQVIPRFELSARVQSEGL